MGKVCPICNKPILRKNRQGIDRYKNQKYCSLVCYWKGNIGHKVLKETRKKIGEKHIGKKLSIEHRKKISIAKKGCKGIWEGKKLSKEHIEKLSLSHLGKKGILSSNWKGGYTLDKIEYRRTWRKNNKLKMKTYKNRRRTLDKNLEIKTVQMVYEDNIKQFGTLTCYLCVLPTPFGKDTLEHKIPLSRGGTNEYNNLAVACLSCNSKKHTKTDKEFIDAKSKLL